MLLRKIVVVFTTLIYVDVLAINIVICLMLNKYIVLYCIVYNSLTTRSSHSAIS